MNLRKFDGKRVRIVSKSGRVFTGRVSNYIWPEDNENNKESIIIDLPNGQPPYEFYEDDITKIELDRN